ncbi:unnamed protein product [Fusarium graminearum]|uniref:Chromosome 2, complete genome n=1 Tax=Gibberella zeae (strain ATCC MYA-4620 / CBS 123657 / FGSC 9075 / NRRL 31084 / PH-1) TaxID=229533 RepID=I1S8Z5_GIBZE|nr:hypothetical protein FGSG_13324 [Fusarium graminearum PH-1]ESU14654.1 hypothetical protein FGSG_13324 [Fusarium graminearum PH-1]CEF77057.1 unnamed protein product [Fusarium graminearum]CZS80348.1 unnamed protein product [Fusarium graminearum]|eukprot:XP_011320079.1 hypothetical protein FGSG_13324 [Fusarium graminearum PH-1]
MYRLRDLDTSSGRQQRDIHRFTDWLGHLQGFGCTVLITDAPTVVRYCTSRREHSLQRAVGTDVKLVFSPPGLAHAATVPGIQNYAIARHCHLPPFPPPPIEQTSSPSCSISPSKSVPSDSPKSALDRNNQSINDPQSGRSGIHLHLATFHRLILSCRLTVQKKRVTVLNSPTSSSTTTHSAALPGSSPVQSSPAKPSREPKPEGTNLASHPGFCPLVLGPDPERSPSHPFFHVTSLLSIHLPITLLLCSNSISVTATVPTTTTLSVYSHCYCSPASPGYSPLSAPSPHSLTHCTGYRRAHTLSRSLRDRQLAPAYYTPPPNLLGLATVQIEKSHIPLRQAVTHHLNASRLAP